MKKQQPKSTYYELLRDPRWQKKRLEVMERDEFKCTACGDSTKTLNVHHLAYRKGTMPWDYEAEKLTTLCEPCHKHCEEMKVAANFWISSVPPIVSLEILAWLGCSTRPFGPKPANADAVIGWVGGVINKHANWRVNNASDYFEHLTEVVSSNSKFGRNET